MFTAQAFADMFCGMKTLYKKDNLRRMDPTTPVFIASGADDPVGEMGKAVPALEKQLEALGFSDLTQKLYEGARHELVNEINHEEVDGDILSFILCHSH